MFNRREFIGGMIAIGSMAFFKKSVFASSQKIRIGVLVPSHCALPVFLADERGILKKSGIQAEITLVDKMEDIVKGFAKGDFDFAQLTTPLTLAMSAGNPKLPNIPVGITQVLGTNGGVLAVSTKSDVRKLSDLKGKRIGVHSLFMTHSLILNLIFEKSGLDPKDVTLKVVPMSEMVTALKEDQIDGFINPEPLPTLLENKGVSKTLLKTKMFWVNHPCCLLATKRSFIANEKNLVKDVTRAYMIAGLELNNQAFRNKAITEIHEKILPYKQIPLPLLLQAFGTDRTDFYPFPFQSSGVIVANQMKKLGLLQPDVETEKLVKDVFASELALEVIKEAASEVRGSEIPTSLNREERIRLEKT
ncbi:MAG: ABC transporter substrate-binding protein [Nitrospirae bacterium]|nr:ABC transporter substrate-binding protein [Nitrospirota bacterium]